MSAEVTWTDADGRVWRRVGQCNRCGDCCSTGDPFWRPDGDRHAPCRYLSVDEGLACCEARGLDELPQEVRNYLDNACLPWPTEPGLTDEFPLCGFSFELVDGD